MGRSGVAETRTGGSKVNPLPGEEKLRECFKAKAKVKRLLIIGVHSPLSILTKKYYNIII